MQSLQTPPIYFKINSDQLINSHRPTQEQVFYKTCAVKSTEIPTVKAAQINMYVYTHITVHNPTGMREFQIYLLCSETTVPCVSTMVSSADIV